MSAKQDMVIEQLRLERDQLRAQVGAMAEVVRLVDKEVCQIFREEGKITECGNLHGQCFKALAMLDPAKAAEYVERYRKLEEFYTSALTYIYWNDQAWALDQGGYDHKEFGSFDTALEEVPKRFAIAKNRYAAALATLNDGKGGET